MALFDYLRGRRRDPELDLNICIDALVAVDAVGSHDDVVAELRNLLAVLGGSHPPDDLPWQWKSVLAGREHDEHWDAAAVLAVILPSLGGVTVALEGLQLRRGNAGLRFEMTPYDVAWQPLGGPRNITVRAVDDRGGRYSLASSRAAGANTTPKPNTASLLPSILPSAGFALKSRPKHTPAPWRSTSPGAPSPAETPGGGTLLRS